MSYRSLEKVCAYYYDAAVRRRAVERHGSIIYLSSGVNHLPAPSALREQIAREFGGFGEQTDYRFYRSYSGQAGCPLFLSSVLFELRHRLHRPAHRLLGLENVCVSVGGTGGLHGGLDYLSHQGGVRSALVLGMNYSYFSLCCETWGVRYRILLSEEPGRILPTLAEIQAELERLRPDLVIVTQPANPSGEVYSQDEMDGLAALVLDRGLWLLVDEVPHMANPNETEVPHPLASPGLASFPERLLVVNSFSKARSLAGHRMGYVLADPRVIEHLRRANEYTYWSPSNVGSSALAIDMLLRTLIGVSEAGAADLDEREIHARVRQFRHYVSVLAPWSEDYSRPADAVSYFGDAVDWTALAARQRSELRTIYDTYQRNWQACEQRLGRWIVETVPSRHGFNHCVRLACGLTEWEFCRRAFDEAGLDFYTESAFSDTDDDGRTGFWVRLSCATDSAELDLGLDRLERFLEGVG
jgi:aspartate/methionine/tyrosine aminotransferase